MTPSPSDPAHSLVMPFVATVSNGGVFDDFAYAAGWAMGALDAQLRHAHPHPVDATVMEPNGAQADLVAMRNGYGCQLRPSGVDGWLHARFTADTTGEEPT